MSESDSNSKYNLELKDTAELTAAAIALAIIFSLTRNYLYYVVFLHVPIFQYCDVGEIILLAPTVIWWVLYFSSMKVAQELQESSNLENWERLTYPWLFYVFCILLVVLAYKNEPIISVILSITFFIKHWWFIPLLVAYILVMMKAKNRGKNYFRKNPLLAILLAAVWYAIFDSWASYDLLKKNQGHSHQVILTKDGKKIKLNNDLVYAGRTSNYWFIYNPKTNFTRAIKADEFQLVDFDSGK